MQQYLSHLDRQACSVPLSYAVTPLICEIILFRVSRENWETVKTLKSHPSSSRELPAQGNTHAVVSLLLSLSRLGHYASTHYSHSFILMHRHTPQVCVGMEWEEIRPCPLPANPLLKEVVG